MPAVQAGYGGGSLGIIDLQLKKEKGKWLVADSQSSTRETYRDVKDSTTGKTITESTVQPDKFILNLLKADHDATINYVNTPIGKTTDDIHSYFSLVQDDPSIQVVTNAQKWYVEKYIAQNKPEYTDVPILSVGAPFKAGRNGVEEYTEIKKGDLTIRSAGDLYLYDNTLKAIKVKGSVVKEWLEMTAGKFNQIDSGKTEEQSLLDPAFPVYNFDVIDGGNYQIDVTKRAKYDVTGKLINPDSNRVINLTYNGKPVDPNQDFIVVTNNYRAGGGVRANLNAGKVTFGDSFSIQPFGNVLNKVKLSGSDLETVLNNQISLSTAADGTKQYNLDFHVAGFKYTWDGKTGKVVDIFLPDGTRIDKNKEYTVVVNNYMYGNAKYGIKDLAAGLEVGPEDLQATVDYVKSLPKPFEYKAEGRIKQLVPLAL